MNPYIKPLNCFSIGLFLLAFSLGYHSATKAAPQTDPIVIEPNTPGPMIQVIDWPEEFYPSLREHWDFTASMRFRRVGDTLKVEFDEYR